jgi:hypothetical protein
MATRSTIAKLNPDGTVTSIYCHWDGYPDGVGATLAEHYTDPAKLDGLLALGDISFLREEIGEQHDFNNPTEGWTLAYGRDRGEDGIVALVHANVEEWIGFRRGAACEYGYLWDGTSWKTSRITSTSSWSPAV